MIQISIIIPTKNEEKFLKDLLDSIKNQENSPEYEIIISDNKSIDNTKNIAKLYNAILTDWWIPSVARNNGAKIAQWKWLLFLDADMIISRKALKEWLGFLIKTGGKLLTPYITLREDENNFWAKHYYKNSKIWYQISDCTFEWCLMIEKDLFFELWWFDEKMILLEDVDLITKAKKNHKRYSSYPLSYTSGRRFERDGWLKIFFISSLVFFLYKIWWKKFVNLFNKFYKL